MQKNNKRCSFLLAEIIDRAEKLGIVQIEEVGTIPVYVKGILRYYKDQSGYKAYKLKSIIESLEKQDIVIEYSFEKILGYIDELHVFRNKTVKTEFSRTYNGGINRIIISIFEEMIKST
jgi:hypothetical protein